LLVTSSPPTALYGCVQLKLLSVEQLYHRLRMVRNWIRMEASRLIAPSSLKEVRAGTLPWMSYRLRGCRLKTPSAELNFR